MPDDQMQFTVIFRAIFDGVLGSYSSAEMAHSTALADWARYILKRITFKKEGSVLG